MADSTDYKKWHDRAKQDLKMLDLLYNDGLEGIEDSFCYNCQQAAEKLLKTFLVKNEKIAPKSHDLLYLLGKCINYESTLSKLTDTLTILNEYSVSARYPGDFDDSRIVEDAKEAYNCILEVEKEVGRFL